MAEYENIDEVARRLLAEEQEQEAMDAEFYQSDENIREQMRKFEQKRREADGKPFIPSNRLAAAEDALKALSEAQPEALGDFPWEGDEFREADYNPGVGDAGKGRTNAPLGEEPNIRRTRTFMSLFSYTNIKALNWGEPPTTPFTEFRVMAYLISASASSESSSSSSGSSSSSSGSSSSSSGSSSSSSWSSSSSKSSSSSAASGSKTAIVRVKDRWIGWNCSEEPEVRFFDTIEVPMPKREVFLSLPPKFVHSVVPETIEVVSAVPDAPAKVAAVAFKTEKDVKVRAAYKRRLLGRNPKKLVLRVSGVRRNSHDRWHRFSESIKEVNDSFWGAARL